MASYDGVEDLAAFPDPAALEGYRAELLERTGPQVALLRRRIAGPAVRAIEAGTGNGRLLLALAAAGHVAQAHGVDLAASRIEFARRWAADAGLDGLSFAVADALSSDFGHDASLVLCITGALGYFGAMHPRRDGDLIDRLAAAAAPGALLCLEVYPHPGERELLDATGGSVQTWRELPQDDPWRFYLSALSLDGEILTHRKTFVHRTEARVDDDRVETLYLYDENQVEELLLAHGFEHVECLEGWSDQPYAGGDVMVVFARRH